MKTKLLLCGLLLCALFSCAKKSSLSSLIESKDHDEFGVYHIVFDNPRPAEDVKKELALKGYKVKNGYYFDGLEKKEDRYKFLWFYGKEYQELSSFRINKGKQDSLLALKSFPSYLEALQLSPKLKSKDTPQKGLEFVSNMRDAQLYLSHYDGQKIELLKNHVLELPLGADDLIAYKNQFGIDNMILQKTHSGLPFFSKEELSKILQSYGDTNIAYQIKIQHLSNAEDMNELKRIDKSYNLMPALTSIDYSDINGLSEKKVEIKKHITGNSNIQRLTASLLDKYVDKNIRIPDNATAHQVFDIKRTFIQNRIEVFGQRYYTTKMMAMTNKINGAFNFEFTEGVIGDLNKLFKAWEWNAGNQFVQNSVLLENVRASKKQDKKEENSMLEAILFEEVYNKKFEELSSESSLDNISYLMIEGTYLLEGKSIQRFPFHAIYSFNEKGENSIRIDEFVLANQGTPYTYFDGKKRGGKFYYDRDHPRLMRRIKG